MLLLRLGTSLCDFQPGRQNKNSLNNILQSRTTLKYSNVLYQKSQMKARESPFMHPSCLEAHATPRHESGDRAPCNPPSTRQHPLTPATAPGSPVVPCSRVHACTRNEIGKKENEPRVPREKWKKQKTAGKVRQVIKEGDFQVGALRGQGCTNRARSESEISVGMFVCVAVPHYGSSAGMCRPKQNGHATGSSPDRAIRSCYRSVVWK